MGRIHINGGTSETLKELGSREVRTQKWVALEICPGVGSALEALQRPQDVGHSSFESTCQDASVDCKPRGEEAVDGPAGCPV
jgi:hypothetical protein